MRELAIFLEMLLLAFLLAFLCYAVIPAVLSSMPTSPITPIEYYEIAILAVGAIVFLILYFARDEKGMIQ